MARPSLGVLTPDDPALDPVRTDLVEGERILWAEVSETPPMFDGCSLRVMLPAAAAAWSIAGLCFFLLRDPRLELFGYFLGFVMILAAIAGILIAFVMLGANLEYAHQLRHPEVRLNILTTRRAIIRGPEREKPRRSTQVITLYPGQIWMIAREESADGRGNVVFEITGSQGERSFPVKFENVADVRTVESLARSTLLPHHHPAAPSPEVHS